MTSSSMFFGKSNRSPFDLARRLCLPRHLLVGSRRDFFHSPPPYSFSTSPVFLARFCHPCFFHYASGVSGEPTVADELKVDDKDAGRGEDEVYDDVIKCMEQLAAYEEERARNCAIVKFLENMRIEVAVSNDLPPGKTEVRLHSVAEYGDLMNILSKPDLVDESGEAFKEAYVKEKIHNALMKAAIQSLAMH